MPEAVAPATAMPAVAPSATAPIRQAAQALQLGLVSAQLRRVPYPVMLADAFIAWLLIRADLASTVGVAVWFGVSMVASLCRAWAARRHAEVASAHATARIKQLMAWFFVVGLTRTWPILVVFQGQSHDVPYLVTMVMMGLAAGGVGSVVGMVSVYLAWAVPVAGALIAAWLSQGSFEGRWIALLLLLMFLLLTAYVRDYGRTLREQVALSENLRAERDRADAERARAETERQRAENAVVARTRFFAAASHDLRQPLGVLRWYGDAVKIHAGKLDHEPLLAIGEGIGRALERAEPLVRKYLDIAQMDAQARKVQTRPCNVVTSLERVHDAHAREAGERGLLLRLDLRSPVACLGVSTDESLLYNILDNLLGNALKFTPQGSVTLGAERVRQSPKAVVRVWVQDTGIGIPAEEHERVFDDFYQVGNRERSQSKGVGLGLAIARRQAGLIGIGLQLQSQPGQGARFELELPALEESIPAEDNAPQPLAPLPAGRRVLVIDDEPEVRLSLRLMLESAGWQVRTASGLATALAELEQGFVPEALVIDYRLQGEYTGTEVVGELRASGCAAPAVIVTGDTGPEQLQLLQRAGLPVLHKPVQGERLIATLVDAITQGLRPAPVT